ncbi:hypothetical protein [Chroococcus sp. FPU101]|uniref:hypothetical protein n=1 Tax=Chroococcus sp. FPU101 TaxID=1974212 RepID=UPI001A8BFEEC|nr:hypothetical protein [Chroococcus sp. FPU101]GFE68229.1 conserved hypothetical protein [Chroococcus sp. FPU101]
MLNEFRTRYPNGGLISELLLLDHGKYIVRVSVQIEGVIIATGIAAADTVETAEDQARIRAIALLNLDEKPTTNHKEQNSKKSETVIPQKATVTQAKTEKKVKPALPITPPIEFSEPISEPEELGLYDDISEELFDKTEPAEIEDEPISLINTEEPPSLVPEPPQKVTTSEPTDYSDVIAKTNLEMKRLGWTSEQGRDYLISTYGKRSRQLLEDEQLIEFLQYLESLPTP